VDLAALVAKPCGKGYGDGSGRGRLLVSIDTAQSATVRGFLATEAPGSPTAPTQQRCRTPGFAQQVLRS
jgi:hypothetical protein